MDAPNSGLEALNPRPVVHFLPLGGLGQIGMNCFALEQDEDILVVDCGASFPEDDIGEELIVPELGWLKERRSKVVGVFITHGHEDHIGAIAHLFDAIGRDVPIYAPAHAAALMAARLSESNIFDADMRIVEPGQSYSVGPFTVEPVAVAHSIVQATALHITTKVGRIVHTADFDLDEEQPAGWLTNEQRFVELGDQGVRLLLSDSTNIDTPERLLNEGDVAAELISQVGLAKKRVVVALFSSNVHRLLALIFAAQQSERKLCLLGRSLRRHFELARKLGHLQYPSDLLVAQESLAQLAPESVLVIAGGSQGEVTSALRKVAQGQHAHLSLTEGDRVILSSRVIPGNEKRVFAMLTDFMRLKVELITREHHPRIHVSGHASRSELKRMLMWVRPQAFVPVHGTLSHLLRHQQLAEECGVKNSLVVENGQKVAIYDDGPLEMAGGFPCGVNRLTASGQVLDGPTRRQRFALARNGVIAVTVQLDEQELLIGLPMVTSSGVVGVDQDQEAMSKIVLTVVGVTEKARGRRMQTLELTLTRAVRATVLALTATRPIVMVHVVVATARTSHDVEGTR